MKHENMLGLEIKAIANRMVRSLEGAARDIGEKMPSSAQKHTIAYLYEHKADGDLFQRDIEEFLSIQRPTATRMLNHMEANGLINRESVEYDGRLKKIILTTKAIDLYNDIFDEINRIEKYMTRGLTDKEKDEFLRVARKIRRNLE
jgi:DNA-binding MarR family transcriptional regulator